MLDLLCMGGATVDLFAEQLGAKLENVSSFVKYVGSSAANIAIGVSRLGLKAGLLTRVGNDAMGRYLLNFLEKEEIDISHVHVDLNRYTGLQLIETGFLKQQPILYYRENSADMAIRKEDFQQKTFQNTRVLLVTGTCCARKRLYENTFHAIDLARKAGCKVILDIEYRDMIWKLDCKTGKHTEEIENLVLERLRSIFEICDLIIGTEKELLVATKQQTVGAALSFLREHTDALILQKRGSQGCVAYPNHLQAPIAEEAYTVDAKSSFGSGDAFVSGFLRGYLKDLPIEECCQLANANQAIVMSRKRCAQAMPYWEELQYFMKTSQNKERTEQFHSSLKRTKHSQDLCVLAFDHRTHFQKYAAKHSCSEQEISQCKELLYQALLSARKRKGEIRFGCLIDDLYGIETLQAATESGEWTGRPIEEAGVFPLAFLHGDEASYHLRTWPKSQIVKVLCYLVEDENQMLQQLKKLHDLFLAAEQTGHDLFIGFNFQEKKQESLQLVSKAIEKCYRAGICPAWWNLPLMADESSWKEIESSIQQNDPYCSGVLLYSHNHAFEEFGLEYRKMKESFPVIKGCTCGRFLWGEPAEKWLRGEVDNQFLVAEVSDRLIMLTDALYGAETAKA